MSQVPENHPLMKAWKTHQATADFANSKRWAAVPEHLQGSLWTLFMAGFNAGLAEGRLRGLEEAAAICRTQSIEHAEGGGEIWVLLKAETAIRALIKEPKA